MDDRGRRTGYRQRELPLAGRRAVALAVGAFAVLPFVAATIALVQGWQATGDVAIIGLRARDAWGPDAPLVGQPTTAEEFTGTRSHHPGPIEFWWLGLTTRVTGPRAGLVLGAAALNAAALAGTVALAFRRGGPVLLALVSAALAGLVWSLGAGSLFDPFNSELATYPMLLALLATWSVAVGDLRVTPVLAGAATVAAQVHVAGAAFVAPLVLTAAAVVAWAWWRHPAAVRRDRAFLVGALAVVAVGWLPPLAQELSAGPSNVAALWRAATAPRPRIGLAFATERLATAVSPIPLFLHRTGRFGFLAQASALQVLGAAAVLGGAGSLALAGRRPGRRNHPGVLVALVLGATATSLVAAAGQPPLSAFRADGTRWLWVVALGTWVAAAWAGWALVPEAIRDRARRPVLVGATAAAVGLVVATVATARLSTQRDGDVMAATDRAATATVAAVPRGRYHVAYEGNAALVTVGPGIAYRLEAAGRDVVVDDSPLTRGYGDHRTRAQATDGSLRITSDAGATAGAGERLVAEEPLGTGGRAGTIKVFVGP